MESEYQNWEVVGVEFKAAKQNLDKGLGYY